MEFTAVERPAYVPSCGAHQYFPEEQLGRLNRLHERWRFVGAGPPACRHSDIEHAQVHAELAAMLVPVAEHDVSQELRSRLSQDLPSTGNDAPGFPHCRVIELWQ